MAPADSNEDDTAPAAETTDTPESDAEQQTIRQRVFFSDAAARIFLEETEARANARNDALTAKLDEVIAVLHDIVRLQSRFVLPLQDARLQPPVPGTQPAPRNNNGHGNNGLFGAPRGPPRNPPPPDPSDGQDPPTPTPPVPPVPTETKPQAYKLPGKAPSSAAMTPWKMYASGYNK